MIFEMVFMATISIVVMNMLKGTKKGKIDITMTL
jgi:hypothetical protein